MVMMVIAQVPIFMHLCYLRVLELVMDFREVMQTSAPKLARCGRGGGGSEAILKF